MASRPTSVPDNYDGREQAWIKHQLLESYLDKLLHIIGAASKRTQQVEICYVDCFAGPWGDETEEMQGTSIAISLHAMARCQQKLSKLGVQARMRAMYIELEPRAFSRLELHLACATPAGVEAQCIHGDFLELRQRILDWCGQSAFTFFFIDPKGWIPVGVDKLRPLLKRPRSEFLINFMYDFVNRTASMAAWQKEIATFLAVPVQDVQALMGQSPSHREARLLGHYREGLKSAIPHKNPRYRPRSAYVRVLSQDKERAKYHLVYLTTHPKGIIEFMEISQEVDLIQHSVRAARRSDTRLEQTGVADMFAGDEETEAQSILASPQDVDSFWLNLLSEEPQVFDMDAFADILEKTGWMPMDLQASLKRLIEAGLVSNLDARRKRVSKPLHYQDGERLVRLSSQQVQAQEG